VLLAADGREALKQGDGAEPQRLLDCVGVRVLHHLEPKNRTDALDAAMNDDEAVERQELQAVDHGLLAGAGQARDAEEGRAYLAVPQGEEEGLEHARPGARNTLLALLAGGPGGAPLDRLEALKLACPSESNFLTLDDSVCCLIVRA
jgi:hypothetical protein